MLFKTWHFPLVFIGFALISVSCNKDDDDPDDVFGKGSEYFVDYTLDGENHRYNQKTKHYPIVGYSSSVGFGKSEFDYDFGLADASENYSFFVEMGTVKSPSNIMYDGIFWDFFEKRKYQYERDTVKPWVSMAFIDKDGAFWYTDSADNSSSNFSISDTVGYYNRYDWSATKKIKATFSCNVAQRKGEKSKKITNGQMIATFESY